MPVGPPRRGRSSCRSSHGARSLKKACTRGVSGSASGRHARATCTSPAQRRDSNVSGLPQVPQKERRASVEEAYRTIRSSPATNRNAPASKDAHVTNAAACARRQIEQWQFAHHLAGIVTVNRTAPHRQPPVTTSLIAESVHAAARTARVGPTTPRGWMSSAGGPDRGLVGLSAGPLVASGPMRVVGFRDRLRPELAELRAYPIPSVAVAVKLDANENPYRLSESARAELATELARVELNRYPDPRATRVRELLAEQLHVTVEQVLVGNGVDEIISLVSTAFARPSNGRAPAVLYPWPSFVMFRITARGHGLRTVEVPLDERWQLPVEATLAAIEAEDPGVIFLPTPNNPTGNKLDAETMRAVIETSPSALTIIDEAYYDFSRATLVPLVNAFPSVAVFRTLSKMGLAGLRVGALIGRADLVGEIDKVRQPYNLNALSQRAAELALTRFKDELAEQATRIVADREKLRAGLTAMAGVTVYPSDANFLLLRVGDAGAIWKGLLDAGVLVRNLDAPGALKGCLRVTVGTPAENQRFLESLGKLL